ncbi:MAG: GGDEF domain-containing protein [Pseudooceanicola sp.]
MDDGIRNALDRICPMHVLLDRSGHVVHSGPTLRKLRPGEWLAGRPVLDMFETLQPSGVDGFGTLCTHAGTKLRLALRGSPRTLLSGVLMPLGGGYHVLNLSFGISIVEAVREYTLTNSDFAPTDLAVEMLFLVEAKSAAMEAMRQMSLRFDGARIAAEEQALIDPVTGLRNRRALERTLDRLIEHGQEFALMHVDLDHFKRVNDTLGHAAGDHVLTEVARIMVEETRGEDTVARVGGDEFVLVFHNLCDRQRLGDLARRLIARLEAPMTWSGQTCRISASAGTAISTEYRHPDVIRMAADADAALYAAKRAGRGRHEFCAAETAP